MLHALVRRRGHARVLFLDKCGGFVRCDEACEKAAGPPPANPAAIPMSLHALRVTIAVAPDQPSSATDRGAFQVIVAVTNPASQAMVLTRHSRIPVFSVRVMPGDWRLIGDQGSRARELRRFAAGETRQYVFDLVADDPNARVPFSPGENSLIGRFDTLTSAPMRLRILP